MRARIGVAVDGGAEAGRAEARVGTEQAVDGGSIPAARPSSMMIRPGRAIDEDLRARSR